MSDRAGIVQFITAQLDADEAFAREAGGKRRGDYLWHSAPGERGEYVIGTECGDLVTYTVIGSYNADHIARWNPERVLAEIAAKRRILERHASYDFPYNPDDGPGDYAWTPSCDHCHEPWPCPDVRDVAAPYSGREGWKEKWAVDAP